MIRLLPLILLLALQLSGCAASWATHQVYAPYDARMVADAKVAVIAPVVTTRPDTPETPWGGQSQRFLAAILTESDGPFVGVEEVAPDALSWSVDSWGRVDDVVDALLVHSPNPFPQGEHRLVEGVASAAEDEIGVDGLVLLVAVQPSMKETLARLVGASGEVTRFSGFQLHMGEWDENEGDPPTHHAIEEPENAGEPDTQGEPSERKKKKKKKDDQKMRLLGKQNRVDVAFLLVDRRSGRFVASHSARLEPSSRPMGSYRGAIRRALREWRLEEAPWTDEIF